MLPGLPLSITWCISRSDVSAAGSAAKNIRRHGNACYLRLEKLQIFQQFQLINLNNFNHFEVVYSVSEVQLQFGDSFEFKKGGIVSFF